MKIRKLSSLFTLVSLSFFCKNSVPIFDVKTTNIYIFEHTYKQTCDEITTPTSSTVHLHYHLVLVSLALRSVYTVIVIVSIAVAFDEFVCFLWGFVLIPSFVTLTLCLCNFDVFVCFHIFSSSYL